MQRRALSLVLLVALAVAACAGVSARAHALWPAVVAAWPAVKADVERARPALGDSVVFAVLQVDAAIQADDWRALRDVDLHRLDRFARAGVQSRVDTGEISVGVSLSLLERITKFSSALLELSTP